MFNNNFSSYIQLQFQPQSKIPAFDPKEELKCVGCPKFFKAGDEGCNPFTLTCSECLVWMEEDNFGDDMRNGGGKF